MKQRIVDLVKIARSLFILCSHFAQVSRLLHMALGGLQGIPRVQRRFRRAQSLCAHQRPLSSRLAAPANPAVLWAIVAFAF